MHIETSREELLPALNKVGGVVERRQTLPILGNLLVSAKEDGIDLVATDLEIEIQTRFAGRVIDPGEVTIPARKFIDICRALPDLANVTLKTERDRALIFTGRSKFSLSTLPAADFPIVERFPGDVSLVFKQKDFRYLLEKTAFAMAHQDVRYYLNGMLFEVHPDRVVTVSTDGHRLAKVEAEAPEGVSDSFHVILPRKAVIELNRLVGVGEGTVRVDLSEKTFSVFPGESVLTSKLVDGRYPDYEKVIPIAPDKCAVADKEKLRQALLRTSILSNEKYRGVRLSFDAGQLRLQTHNPEQEQAEEELEVEYDSEATAIGFNVGYLLDVLSVLEGEEVEVRFTDSNSSAVIRSKGQDKETFVVMPMRL
jgi:DNA polymerase-3 subunit beta